MAVPIVLGLIKEFLAWRRRRRARQSAETAEVEHTGTAEGQPVVEAEVAHVQGEGSGSKSEVAEVGDDEVLAPPVEAPPPRALRSRRKPVA